MWWLITRKGLLMYMWDCLGGITKPMLKKSRFYRSTLHVVIFDMDVGSQDVMFNGCNIVWIQSVPSLMCWWN
jgi:hypothetical protein